MVGSIRVLHVDDQADFVEMAAELIERENEAFSVETATRVEAALDQLPGEYDCVVSDYDMPVMNGVDFLLSVREAYPELPFILYTGKGSEEVASKAISAGVTEYLQKSGGAEQYSLLARKIENAADQYRSKRRLAASKDRLALFIDQSPLGVIEWNLEFEVERMNEAAEEILGYDEAELRGQSWKTIVPESDQGPVDAVISELGEAEGGFHSINENVRKDGTRITCEWHNRVITDDDEVVAVFSQFQDITERQQQRVELERQADLFEKAQAIAQVGAWEWDLRSGEGYGTPQTARITGQPEQFGIGSIDEWLELFHPDDRSRFQETFEQAVEAGEEYDLKVRVLHPTDDLRWVRVRGEPQYEDGALVRVRGTMQDITEESERESELKEANQLLSTLFKTIPIGVAVLDSSGAIVRANTHAEDVLGLTESELTDRTYDDPEWAIHDERGDSIPPEELPFARALGTGQPVYNYEHGIRWPDGRDRWLSINAAPITDQNGEVVQVVATVTDVTEAREVKLRIEEKNRRLEEFAQIVSHDLRNPLTVAQGRLQLAREEHDTEDLEAIARAHERMTVLIEDLLRLAREGEAVEDLESVDLDELAEECWETVDRAEARLETTSGLRLAADRSRLKQLIENLVRNAIEHGGDEVSISLGALDSGFYLEDDGPGIPEDIRDDVLSPGFTTSEEGIGYGLSIVADVAEAHGWDLQITEGTDGGARFEITGVEFAE